MLCCTHPDFADFFLVDGDVVPIDVDVGQAHVGDNLVTPPVIVLLVDGEGLQGGVGPAVLAEGLGQGVGAGAHEVIVAPIEGAVVGITKRPASCHGGGHTPGSAIGHLAGLLLPALHRAAGGHPGFWGQDEKERATMPTLSSPKVVLGCSTERALAPLPRLNSPQEYSVPGIGFQRTPLRSR
uniref:Uncharacterized protein n=1 Tax=Terrapene triunguis TaxID=2587831 RepID=A0A674J715_9SAUR